MKLIKFSFFSIAIILLLFYIFSFLYRSDNSFDQDLGRHFKLGEIILTNGVPKTNLFSYTFPNLAFINHHYLFEILVFKEQELFGIQNLLILKLSIIILAVFITFKISSSKSIFLLPISFIFLHVLRERVDLRPEVFSFLFTALTYFILDKFEKKYSKMVFILPFIQLLWTSTHIYFLVGIALQSIFLINFYFTKIKKQFKTLLIIIIASIASSLINPNGLNGLLYPLQVFGNYGYTIAENQNLFLLESINFRNPNYLFVKFSGLIILISIIFAFLKHNLSWKNFLLSLFGLTLALFHVRSFPYLVFISLPAVLGNFSIIKQSKFTTVLFILIIPLLLLESFFYLSGEYYLKTNSDTKSELTLNSHGEKALDFVLQNNLPQPIFNNFDIGSYIIYRGFPKYKVFVDGRPEAYPASFFQNVYIPMQETPENFAKIDKEINFQTIIFSHTDQTPWGKTFLSTIIKNPNWKIVYLDDFMIILIKKDENLSLKLKEIDLDSLNPSQYQFNEYMPYLRLSFFLLNTNHITAAKLFDKKALEIAPDSPIANLIMSVFSPQIQTYLEKSKNEIWW
ncbi:MAG: hypothetical protein Q7R43_00585 [Candidatus Daviesbacteria bacterium]|nr:hypothetical protein [Candidatus Daviesbacteria bacterium]